MEHINGEIKTDMGESRKYTITFESIKKQLAFIAVFVFLFYLFWVSEAFYPIPILLYSLCLFVFFSTFVYFARKKIYQNMLSRGLLWWLCFAGYSLLTGVLLASNRSLIVSSVSTYVAFWMICACINMICLNLRTIDWILKQLIILCLICAIYTILHGYGYYNGVIVRTMGPENNPNTLGAMMVFGMFAIMYRIEPKLKNMIYIFPFIVLFLYIIILTGSKKALLAAAIMLMIWFVGFLAGIRKNEHLIIRLITYIVLGIIVCVGIYYFITQYINTVSFVRMKGLFDSGSTSTRIQMYLEAYKIFKENILVGVGYNHYRVVSSMQTYSHSTYAELLADTGIVGVFLFLFPIIKVGNQIIKYVLKKRDYYGFLLLALYLIEIFLGSVIIFMYEFMHLFMWSILFAIMDIIRKDMIKK